MKSPFIFGITATGKNFTDRKKETEKLVGNFISSVNTIIISPRGWGKSSLLARAARITSGKDKKIIFCFVDLLNTRTEEHFYTQFAKNILQASASKTNILIENISRFIKGFIPSITVSPG